MGPLSLGAAGVNRQADRKRPNDGILAVRGLGIAVIAQVFRHNAVTFADGRIGHKVGVFPGRQAFVYIWGLDEY